MTHEARCSHPGCGRRATDIAVVESAWEDTATGSALMVCSDHAERYLADPNDARPRAHHSPSQDAMLRAHRRSADGSER